MHMYINSIYYGTYTCMYLDVCVYVHIHICTYAVVCICLEESSPVFDLENGGGNGTDKKSAKYILEIG